VMNIGVMLHQEKLHSEVGRQFIGRRGVREAEKQG